MQTSVRALRLQRRVQSHKVIPGGSLETTHYASRSLPRVPSLYNAVFWDSRILPDFYHDVHRADNCKALIERAAGASTTGTSLNELLSRLLLLGPTKDTKSFLPILTNARQLQNVLAHLDPANIKDSDVANLLDRLKQHLLKTPLDERSGRQCFQVITGVNLNNWKWPARRSPCVFNFVRGSSWLVYIDLVALVGTVQAVKQEWKLYKAANGADLAALNQVIRALIKLHDWRGAWGLVPTTCGIEDETWRMLLRFPAGLSDRQWTADSTKGLKEAFLHLGLEQLERQLGLRWTGLYHDVHHPDKTLWSVANSNV